MKEEYDFSKGKRGAVVNDLIQKTTTNKIKKAPQNKVEYSCGMNWFENGGLEIEEFYKNGKLIS
jgi:hypothetical protein